MISCNFAALIMGFLVFVLGCSAWVLGFVFVLGLGGCGWFFSWIWLICLLISGKVLILVRSDLLRMSKFISFFLFSVDLCAFLITLTVELSSVIIVFVFCNCLGVAGVDVT